MQKFRTKIYAPKVSTADLEAGSKTVGESEIGDGAVTAAKLASNAVETVKIKNANVTEEKMAANSINKTAIKVKAVDVTISTGNATGSSAADPDLVNGLIIGHYPTGNQDQFVDSVVLNGDGSITITLAANATADNTFKVIVSRA